MRPIGRRRPTGKPQVPELLPTPSVLAAPTEPTILRLGRDRLVLDSPWDIDAASAIGHVWPDDTIRNGWIRRAWPMHPESGRFVAPLDLHVGHVIEIGWWIVDYWHAVYTWVADIRDDRIVLVPAATARDAVSRARSAVDVWRTNELAILEQEWRQRIDSASRSR